MSCLLPYLKALLGPKRKVMIALVLCSSRVALRWPNTTSVN